MTREEAIRWLTNEKWKNANNKYKKEWNEAFDMAIDALQADVVSREVYDKRTQADEEIIDSYRQEFQKALSADAVPHLKQTDTLLIADALRYLMQDTNRHLADRTRADALREQMLAYGASMCKPTEGTGEWVPVSESGKENHDGEV